MEEQIKAAIDLLKSSLDATDQPSGSAHLSVSGSSSHSGTHGPSQPSSSHGFSNWFSGTPASSSGRRNAASGSCGRAISAIRGMRERLQLSESEHKANFASSKKCGKPWIGKFVCLDKANMNTVPCSKYDKTLLLEAGLGEKKIMIPNVDNCTYDQFRELLVEEFPKLDSCGGFELLRCIPNSKQLEVISHRLTGSPKLLKSMIGAGRIFIRPIQRDLTIEPVSVSEVITEKCIHCNRNIEIHNLRCHVNICRWESLRTSLSDSDEDFNPPFTKRRIVLSSESDEEDVIETAINASFKNEPKSKQDIILSLKADVLPSVRDIDVRREAVLEDAIKAITRADFCFQNTLYVNFLGEQGDDAGGLKREFFAILTREIKQTMFQGVKNKLCPMNDLKNPEKYFYIGQLIALGIVQGDSPGIPFLSPPIYQYLCGADMETISMEISDVPKSEIREFLEEIENVCDSGTLKELCCANEAILAEVEYIKHDIILDDRLEIFQKVLRYHALGCFRAEVDNLKNGLEVLGVGHQITVYGRLMKSLFVAESGDSSSPPLSALCCCDFVKYPDTMKSLFKDISFSEPGSNNLIKEKCVYMLFLDLLYDIEDGKVADVSLPHILNFITGCDHIPPLGFEKPLSISFYSTSFFPMSATCGFQLILPTMYFNKKDLFREKLIYAFLNHGGFGNN